MKLRSWVGVFIAVLLLLFISSYLLAYLVIHPSDTVKAGWNAKLEVWGMDSSTTPLSRHQLVYEDVEFIAADGLSISAWYIPVENSGKAIVSFHGGNSDRRAFLDAVPAWHQAGFNVLMPDYRSHGRSEIDPSGLSYGLKESLDGIAAIDWLVEQKSIERIGLIGASLGSAAALMTADKSKRVDALVLQSAGYDFSQLFKNVMPFLPDLIARNGARMMLWLTGVSFADAWSLNYPLLGAMQELSIPVFFIHGSEDRIVLPSEARALYEIAREPKQFWLLEGMAHEPATDREPRRYPARVAMFFKRHL